MLEVAPDSFAEFLERFPEARRYRPFLNACPECVMGGGLGVAISREGLDAVRPLFEALEADSPEAVAFLIMLMANLPLDGDIPVPFDLLVADESGMRTVSHCPHRCTGGGM